MSNNKKIIIGLSAIVTTGIVLFFIKPKAKIILRKDGSGLAQLGFKKKEFTVQNGINLISWNGYELTVSNGQITFRKWGRELQNPDKSPKIELVAE